MSNGLPTPSRGSRGSIKGTMDIQGLIALAYQPDAKATFDWMVANPESNPQLTDNKKFIGIGGHLFAIDVDKSIEYGTDRLS